jgi:ubiquinone biosynthesis protein Coq4
MKTVNQTFHRLQMMKSFFALVGDPTKTDHVFKMADEGRAIRGPLLKITIDGIAKQDGFMELYSKKYSPTLPALSELERYPINSFGYAFARHMLDNGLEVDFFPEVSGQGLEPYVIQRGRQVHDLWHVLTGFDTSVVGEVGLQGFTLAQLNAPFSAILISGGLLHSILRAPATFTPMVEQLFAGYETGRRAKRLIGLPIEEYLKEDLGKLRARLGIKSAAEIRYVS